MKKDIKILLNHILESINLIEEYAKGKDQKEFTNSKQLQDSIIRRIEIIGEAVENIPEDFRDQFPEIPWKKISGMRDILVHQYFAIDIKLTWEVVRSDLPDLKEKLIKIKTTIE